MLYGAGPLYRALGTRNAGGARLAVQAATADLLAARLTVAGKCVHLEPLAPWPLDPANPQARAFIGRTVTCLQGKGYHAAAILITNIPIEPPEWFVRYSPKALNYTPRRPVAAEDACHERALR